MKKYAFFLPFKHVLTLYSHPEKNDRMWRHDEKKMSNWNFHFIRDGNNIKRQFVERQKKSSSWRKTEKYFIFLCDKQWRCFSSSFILFFLFFLPFFYFFKADLWKKQREECT